MSLRQPRLVLTPGEPAGIGPDLTLLLAGNALPVRLAVLADPAMLRARAAALGISIQLELLAPDAPVPPHQAGRLTVQPLHLPQPAVPGQPDPANAESVLTALRTAVAGCLAGRFDALVTGPVHKGVINTAGVPFTGHTEFLAGLTGGEPVMLLVAGNLRVALATTHLPLAQVSAAITPARLQQVLTILASGLRQRFQLAAPRILVCGLNPHAGEGGHLGREEQTVITPTLNQLRQQGLALQGPVPADTAFTPASLARADAVLAMYHDQGLPVLKHVGFGHAVNVTLGLPIIRTSVDHGTALDLAGTGRIDTGSLRAAIDLAGEQVR